MLVSKTECVFGVSRFFIRRIKVELNTEQKILCMCVCNKYESCAQALVCIYMSVMILSDWVKDENNLVKILGLWLFLLQDKEFIFTYNFFALFLKIKYTNICFLSKIIELSLTHTHTHSYMFVSLHGSLSLILMSIACTVCMYHIPLIRTHVDKNILEENKTNKAKKRLIHTTEVWKCYCPHYTTPHTHTFV